MPVSCLKGATVPISFFLKIRLHSQNQQPRFPGRAKIVSNPWLNCIIPNVGGGGGGGGGLPVPGKGLKDLSSLKCAGRIGDNKQQSITL